jgi:hypothetical protein
MLLSLFVNMSFFVKLNAIKLIFYFINTQNTVKINPKILIGIKIDQNLIIICLIEF